MHLLFIFHIIMYNNIPTLLIMLDSSKCSRRSPGPVDLTPVDKNVCRPEDRTPFFSSLLYIVL